MEVSGFDFGRILLASVLCWLKLKGGGRSWRFLGFLFVLSEVRVVFH